MPRRIPYGPAIALLAAGLLVAACSRDRHGRSAASGASSAWPDQRSPLAVLTLQFPDGFGVRKVFVDAGHGAPGNTGNVSSLCEDEQEFTLAASRRVAETLRAAGHFDVRVSREGADVPYPERVRQAEEWGAEVFVSLHSDVRGKAELWSPRDGARCPRADEGPGFAILFSDEGDDTVAGARRRFAAVVAERMGAAGFLPYDGAEYTEAYAPLPSARGVFIDRHAPGKRIYVLRNPSMPSILIETHNALFPAEVERFREPRTLDALAAAVASALIETLPPVRPLPGG